MNWSKKMVALKHNKKRNTAFLYEVLVREVVMRTMAKDLPKRNIAVSILKEFFASRSELYKELELYKSLTKTKNLKPHMAEKMLHEAKKIHRSIDKEKLFQEQSELIKKINKKLSKEVFVNFVPNYKNLATIAQIFNDDLKLKSRVLLEETIVSSLTSKLAPEEAQSEINRLVMKTFTKSYNKEYSNSLLDEQKALLNKYVLSFSDNGVDFKMFLNEEVGRIKTELLLSKDVEEFENDFVMSKKLDQVIDLLESFRKTKINRPMLLQILKAQELVSEINN